MARNVATSPAVAKAVARVKKFAQNVREARTRLRAARKKLCAVVQAVQQRQTINSDVATERLALVEQTLAQASPHGLSMTSLCE